MWSSLSRAVLSLDDKGRTYRNRRATLVRETHDSCAAKKDIAQPDLTPLMLACRDGLVQCARVLIANGVDVNMQGPKGYSCLRVRLKTLDFFLCVVTHLLSVQHTRISFFASRQHLDARAALVGLVATASRRPDCSQSGVVRPASSLSDRATTIGARARALTDTRRCASVP